MTDSTRFLPMSEPAKCKIIQYALKDIWLYYIIHCIAYSVVKNTRIDIVYKV